MKKVLLSRRKQIANIVFIALVYLFILLIQLKAPNTSMWFSVIKKVCVFALAAVSMNLLNGFTGLFSLGQAGFMLIGAYTYAILTIPSQFRDSVFRNYGSSLFSDALPIVIALIIAGLIACLFAYLIGLPVLKLKSDYLAIATLGFAEIARNVIQSPDLGFLTNGPDPVNNYNTINSILLYAVIVGICIAVVMLIINSTYGRAFKAVRDDDIAAEAMGINLAHHKRMSFVISSFFAGIAGALYAMISTVTNATNFTTTMTYEILLVVVIGGIGSITGSVIAAFLFYASSEWWLRGLDVEGYMGIPLCGPNFRLVVFSVVIMIIVLFFRRGIMGDKELDIDNFVVKIIKGVPVLVTKKIPYFFTKAVPHFFTHTIPHFFTHTVPDFFTKKLPEFFGRKSEGKGGND